MDVSVILTYRCNSKCSMCNIWQHPTDRRHEITLETLTKLPDDIDYLNLTGGEPTLRSDLPDIVDLLYPKARTLEISTNGLRADVLEPIVRKYPDIKIRISIEGLDETNDRIRGEREGYRRKLETMERLIEAKGCDLGFAITIQDENVEQLAEVYALSKKYGVELATASLHNGFQFHKSDNAPYDRRQVARGIEVLIREMLKSWSVKNWFRAYLNLGLIAKVLGHERLMPCTAGTDFAFVDPWSDVYACNVRSDLWMGNLEKQSWSDIYGGEGAATCRGKVAGCCQNCWMVASAKTAMRSRRFPSLPRWGPLWWVIKNKIRVSFGRPIPFDTYIDYEKVRIDPHVARRNSFLNKKGNSQLQKESTRYEAYGPYVNR